MNLRRAEKTKRRRLLRVPDALYNEAIEELTGNNDPWFEVTVRGMTIEDGFSIITVDIEGEDKFKENRWKRFTMEV